MDIQLQAQKIADKYIAKGADMNSSIAKVASDFSLNIEETKRLVEECNKSCYLTKFASTGEQTFDIADYQKVKSILQSEDIIEKKASVEFTQVDYKKDNAYGLENFNESLEKTACENGVLNQAIEKCDLEISSSMKKIAELKHQFAPLDKIEAFEKRAEEYKLVKNHLIEKRAGLTDGILNIGGKVVGTVVKHPIKAGLMPLGVIGSYQAGAKKHKKDELPMISNSNLDLNKQASSVGEILREAKPYAIAMGLIGIGAATAKGMGGLASKMMTERKLNDSFLTIQKNNEDIRQIPNARAYFDVVARHSPDLAMDPMVAPQLIRQFDMFGGVDVNTVGKLRDMQKSGPQKDDNDLAGNFLGGIKTLQGFMPTKTNKPS